MSNYKFIVMLVAAAAMMFASCDKENNNPSGNDNPSDNPDTISEEMIVGTWNETEVLYIFTQGDIFDVSSMLEEGESVEITFKADKTYTSVYHSTDGDAEDQGTWSTSDSTLTMTDEFGPMNYNIEQLNATVFNIKYDEEGEDEDGPYSLNIIIKMTRI